jgi:hypothetical protein
VTEINIKLFSWKYWREVRRESRRLKVDRREGHGWIWIRAEEIAECYRCGNRVVHQPANSQLVFDRTEFELAKCHFLSEEGLR